MAIEQPKPQPRNPAELLQDQIKLLTEIHQAQDEQVRLLKTQNDQLIHATSPERLTTATTTATSLAQVNLANVSIPFWSLVGLFMKMWLASVFATLLIAAIIGGLVLILSLILTAIGIGLMR